LSASLSGLDFGFSDGADLAMVDATNQLVGSLGGAVVDEAEVESAPQAIERNPPSFPARARALGQSGFVTVSFVVDLDGSTQDVNVVESSPPGVFDEAAIDAVRGWRFNPGQQEGAPVAVRARQTLRFELQ
jgi:protein TonB